MKLTLSNVQEVIKMKTFITRYYKRRKTELKCTGKKPMELSLEELITLSFSNDTFEELHTAWVNSGKETKLVPSLDRIDSKRHYSLDNVQWLSWAENRSKSKYECFRRPVTVVNQYGSDKVPRSYTTLENASKAEGVGTASIRRAIHSGKASKGKFYTEPSR